MTNPSNNHPFSGPSILGDKLNNNINFDDKEEPKSIVPYDSNNRNLSHLTIKQIVTAPDHESCSDIFIDGQRISQLMLYGTVIDIDHQSVHTVITLHDWTARIPIKFWNTDDKIKQKLEQLKRNTVIKCIGRLSVFNGVREMSAFDFWPLVPNKSDFMEYCHFMTEALYAHVANTAAPETLEIMQKRNQSEYQEYKDEYKNYAQKSNNFRANHNKNYNQKRRFGQNQEYASNERKNDYNTRNQCNNNNRNNMNRRNNNSFNPLKSKIYNIIQNESSGIGCSRQTVLSSISGERLHEIEAAMIEMCNNDVIITTIDDDHFDIVDSN